MSNENENGDIADAVFAHLVEEGAIELTGMNASGEPTYRLTEKCAEIFPQFYQEHKRQMTEISYELWAMGLVEIVFADDDEQDRFLFNHKNYEKLQEVYEDLTLEQIDFLQMLGAPIEYHVTKKEF